MMIARLRTAGLRLFCFARRAHRWKIVGSRSEENGLHLTDQCMTCELFQLRVEPWESPNLMSRFRGQA